MTKEEIGGAHIVNAIAEGKLREREKQAAKRRKGKTALQSKEGALITVVVPEPSEACVPSKKPCGCCAGCKKRASLRVALEHGDPAERGAVLAALGLVLLVEPETRGPHTSPLLSEAGRARLDRSA